MAQLTDSASPAAAATCRRAAVIVGPIAAATARPTVPAAHRLRRFSSRSCATRNTSGRPARRHARHGSSIRQPAQRRRFRHRRPHRGHRRGPVLYDGAAGRGASRFRPTSATSYSAGWQRQPNSTQLLLVDAASGSIREVTADDEPARSSSPAWRPDSASFVFNTNIGRESIGIAEYIVATGEIRYLQTADHDLTGWPARSGSRLLLVDRVDGAETCGCRRTAR